MEGGVVSVVWSVTSISSRRQLLPLSKTEPDVVTLTAYSDFVPTEVMFSLLPFTISNNAKSSSSSMLYTGFWPSRYEFCAEITPTIPGMSALAISVLSGTTYHAPKF